MSAGRCIPDLIADGSIPPERAGEISGLYGELERVYRRQFGEQTASAMASEAVLRQLRIAAAQKKRIALLQIQAQQGAILKMKGYNGADPMAPGPIDPRAAAALFDRDGRANYSNVEARRKAIKARSHALMDSLLAEHSRNTIGQVRNKAQLDNVVREILSPGSTKDGHAAELASSWSRTAEMLRGRYNAAGGHIGKLEGGYLPQAHDSRAVKAAGYAAWREFTLPLLDRGRMLDGRTGAPFTDEALELALRDVYETIRTDGWSKLEPGARGGKMLANQRAEHRFLHFRDADAWLNYSGRFGSGSPFDAMMGHIEAMSRDIAAMEILGPNPPATVRFIQDHLERSAALADGNHADRAHAGARQVDRLWKEYTGELRRPENRKIALVFGALRSWQVAAKLGSATLSAVTDNAFQTMTRRLNGLGSTRLMNQYLATFAPGTIETQKMAVRRGLIAEEWSSMAAAQNRYLLEELTGEVSRRMATGVLKASMLARHTQSQRWAFGMELLATLTENVGKKFDQLDQPLRNAMERNGIGADGWELIRKSPLKEDRGIDWLDPAAIESRELGDRLLEWIHTEVDYAVPVADLRTAALMHSVAPAGTFIGETIRSGMLFKGFGISVLLGQSRRIMEMNAGNAVRYAAGLFILTTVLGAAALQLKELSKGKDPRDMTGDNAPEFWGAAILQGGGFGIFGDFLGASENRFGGGFAQTLAGPLVGTASDVADLAIGNAAKALRGDDTDIGRDLVQLLKRETPGGSLWYARLAFERLVTDQLQAELDPNFEASWRRMDKRAEDQGQGFWWGPGEAAPQRAPDLGTATGGE